MERYTRGNEIRMKTYAKCQNCGMMFVPIGTRRDHCGRDCQDVANGIGRRPGEPTPEEIEAACKVLREKRTREAMRLKSA